MNLAVKEKSDSYNNDFAESLKSGYEQMSPINLYLAEESVQSDNEALALSEQNLRSVRLSDS